MATYVEKRSTVARLVRNVAILGSLGVGGVLASATFSDVAMAAVTRASVAISTVSSAERAKIEDAYETCRKSANVMRNSLNTIANLDMENLSDEDAAKLIISIASETVASVPTEDMWMERHAIAETRMATTLDVGTSDKSWKADHDALTSMASPSKWANNARTAKTAREEARKINDAANDGSSLPSATMDPVKDGYKRVSTKMAMTGFLADNIRDGLVGKDHPYFDMIANDDETPAQTAIRRFVIGHNPETESSIRGIEKAEATLRKAVARAVATLEADASKESRAAVATVLMDAVTKAKIDLDHDKIAMDDGDSMKP